MCWPDAFRSGQCGHRRMRRVQPLNVFLLPVESLPMRCRTMMTAVLACIVFGSGVTAAPASARSDGSSKLSEIIRHLNSQDHVAARRAAIASDLYLGHGDLHRAFVDAVIAQRNGNCAAAVRLSKAILSNAPQFHLAYDVIVACLVEDGRTFEARRLVNAALDQEIGNDALRQKLEQLQHALRFNRRPRFAIDFFTTPSSNTSRRTTATSAYGGTVSAESRGRPGVSAGIGTRGVFPLHQFGRLIIEGTLDGSAGMDSITREPFFSAGGGFQLRRDVSASTAVYLNPFLRHYRVDGEGTALETGALLGAAIQTSSFRSTGLNVQLSRRDFRDNQRDGILVSGAISARNSVSRFDRINTEVFGSLNSTENPFYDYWEIGLALEWEHMFQNGLIKSLGSSVRHRNVGSLVPFTSENRKDWAIDCSAGISHRDFTIGQFRPEIGYKYQVNSSNDTFYDYDSHDMTFQLKAAF